MDVDTAQRTLDARHFLGSVSRDIVIGGTETEVTFHTPTRAEVDIAVHLGQPGLKIGSRRYYLLRARFDLQDLEGTFELNYAQYWRFGSYHDAKPADRDLIREHIITAVRQNLTSEAVRETLIDEFARLRLRHLLETLASAGAGYRRALQAIAKVNTELPEVLHGSVNTETGESEISEEMLESALEEMRTRFRSDTPREARRAAVR